MQVYFKSNTEIKQSQDIPIRPHKSYVKCLITNCLPYKILENLVGILFPKGEELKDLLSKTYLPTKYYSDSWKSRQRKSYQQIITVIAENLNKEKATNKSSQW